MSPIRAAQLLVTLLAVSGLTACASASNAGSMSASPAAAPSAGADLVIYGGPIYTAEDAAPTAEAVAVRDGRIVYVGARSGLGAFAGEGTARIDLQGAALFPGFVDGHAHLRGIGERELTLNLEGTKSIAELQETLRAVARGEGRGPVAGRGWIETHWPEKRFPTRQDLDAAVPDRPVILVRADGHALVANSAALRAAGVTRATVAPSGGEILKDAAGEPTGMLIDTAMGLVERLIGEPDDDARRRALQTGYQVYAGYGWTGLHNMSVDWRDVELLEEIGGLTVSPRVYNAVVPEAATRLFQSGPRSAADGRVQTRAIKYYVDGALGSRGAALFEPYSDAPHTRGLVTLEEGEATRAWSEALRRGIQITTHAIGDRGNSLVLDWYDRTFAAVPEGERRIAAPRWRIEHAQVVRPVEAPRFRAHDVIASMQPSHAIGDLHFAPARLGDARLDGAYAWKRFDDLGVRLVGGSDAPVERGDPLIEFYAAVGRRDLQGFQGPDWRPEQALSRQRALRLFTADAAYASFQEADLGTISVGKKADFSAFDVDLMTAPVEAIPRGRAVLTMVDGHVLYTTLRVER